MPAPRPQRGPKAVKMDPGTLLEAAQRVFARDGLDRASLRAIAREAGCDPALIYYHFENKEAMFAALLEEHLPPLAADLRRLARGADPRPTAVKLWLALRLFHLHLKDSAGFRSMVRGQLVRGAEGLERILAKKLLPAQLAVSSILRRGLRTGELRPDLDPFLAALLLIRMEAELLDLVPVLARLQPYLPPGAALPRAERAWFEVFWRGVASDPQAPLPDLIV